MVKRKLYSLSYLRAVSCLAVVLLHVAAFESILFADTLGTDEQFLTTALYMLMYWAVPSFIMVTGALLLDPAREIGFKKLYFVYIRRVLAALIIFGLLFRLFDMVMDGEALTVTGFLFGFLEIFTGTGWSHLWYLYLLIGIYIMLPVFRGIVSACTDRELRYFILIMFLFLCVLPLTRIFGISSGFYIYISTVYPLYFFSGYALHNGIIRLNGGNAALLFILGSAGMLIFTYLNVYGILENTANLLGYSSIFVVMQSAGIFSLFDRMEASGKSAVSAVFQDIDSCSFGIYLIHMVFIRYILRYRYTDLFSFNPVISYTSAVLGIFIISWLIVHLLKKVPFIKKTGII